ncbi:hypothetical protein BDF21DRAFT_409055 [Thamnidium elegans]|uniref:F-box domain-containing protein n=1 Tax=Thamnidium elegans TaxID=101142 RepID=A0A8H7SN68_9FUNG|nr:hypothetical protein INT48_001734 [Thamnidium elegans]KAI8094587.1 hypothetical protein BDF21DRAFT_409055 [Thamnidium elegans]
MSTKCHLAPELLEQIFHFLPHTTQRVCLSVCKSWYITAKPIYFLRINVLSNTNLSKLITSLQTTGPFVQSLTVKAHNRQVTYEGLMGLIIACPFLLQLKLDSIYFEWVWLEGLELNRLKSVSIGDVSWRLGNDNQYFYRVAYRHRNSIEDLHIPCTCDQVLQQEFSCIMEYLSHFENLKRLKLVNGSQSVPVYFDTLLNNCKTLEMLVIELGHPLYPPTESSTKLKPVYKSMRQLEIFLTMFSIEYIQYIMDRFVNIIVLDVCINQSMLDWERDKQNICNFIQHTYFPFIKTLSRSSLTIKMNGSSTMGDLSAQFFSTNEEIKSARFQLDCGRSERTDIKLKTENGDTYLDFLFVRDINNYIELPFINHLQKYGNNIKSLELHISRHVTRSPALDLYFILHHCPSLEKIRISIEQNYPNIYFLAIFPIQHNELYNTVSNFTLDCGIMTPNLIHFISSRLLNLKTLHLIKCTFLFDSEETVFDMSKLNFLDLFVLDTQHTHVTTYRDTCFILTKVHCDNHKRYLLDNTTGKIHVHRDYRVSSNTDTVKFIFSKSIKMEIHTGRGGFKRDTVLIDFP